MIRVYGAGGTVIETHEHKGDFSETGTPRLARDDCLVDPICAGAEEPNA
jgi:hypothetical protein